MKDEQQGTVSRASARKLVRNALSSFAYFDGQEPLKPRARDFFRHGVVPQFKSVVAKLFQDKRYAEVRDVCHLMEEFQATITENGLFGEGEMFQLHELSEEFLSWTLNEGFWI